MSRRPSDKAACADLAVRLGRLRFVRLGQAASLLAILVLVALAVHDVLGSGSELAGAAARLTDAALPWTAVAIAAEALSYLFYAAAQRRLLSQPKRIHTAWLACLAVCAQGVTNFLPAGYLAANLLNFRELRRRMLGPRESARLLVTSSVMYIGALACLTVVAGEVAGSRVRGPLDDVRIGAAVLLVALVVAAGSVKLLARRDVIRLPVAWQRWMRPSGRPPAASLGALALFAGCWLADGGCLLAAIQAVGARPEWSLIPIAYCAAQLVSFVPITPGGLGLVEGSLTVTLASGGGGAVHILAAVLLYRVVSYWGTLPFGVAGYLVVRRASSAPAVSVDRDGDQPPALSDRAAGGDAPLLALEG